MICYFNGEKKNFPCSTKLSAVLAKSDLPSHYVLELNGTILPKNKVPELHLQEGDIIEIIVAVGGG